MQVHYHLLPQRGAFDVAAIEARLKALPGAFRHPRSEEPTWVIAASPAMAKFIASKLMLDPRTSLASQAMLTLAPTGISVYQDAPEAILAQLKPFVTWLMRATPCRVLSEEGEDWTKRYAKNPQALFEEEATWS